MYCVFDFRISGDSSIIESKPSQIANTEVGSAKCVRFEEKNYEKPTYRLILELPCVCSDQSKAVNIAVHNWWICVDCKGSLEYAFDEYFYCKCGRAESGNFRFKCNRSNHGGEFQTFQLEYIQTMLGRIERKEEINILLLGETGVGKSTWINSIVNYMTYPSLEEATKQDKLLNVIGGSFKMRDADFEFKEIKIGDDENELQNTGQSATQNPKSYLFEQETRLVRFIDTPGIADIRGIETDKKNVENILKYLSIFDKLDGVCILLKPNSAKPYVRFRYVMQELLSHLHKDASKNIVFCFTNARSALYKPGDTYPALQMLLKEHKNTVIPLGRENVFCMDNESFRFMCALREGHIFDDNDDRNIATSWEKSKVDTNRMIDYIALSSHIR